MHHFKGMQRQKSVDFDSPPPNPCHIHETQSKKTEQEQAQKHESKVFNQSPKYNLGDYLISSRDSFEESYENLVSVNNLEELDFAFVKRSDSRWSYAMLTRRFLQTRAVLDNDDCKGRIELEEVMLFVVDKSGSTKTVRSNSYGKHIRCKDQFRK